MNLSDFTRMPKEEVKDYLRANNVAFIEEATKEDLVAIARTFFVKGMSDAEETATNKAEADAAKAQGLPAPLEANTKESEDQLVLNALDELKKLGFESKQQVISYLDGLIRERKMLEYRQTDFSERDRICSEREAKQDARDKYLDSKGDEVMKKVIELKELTEKNQDQILKLSRLSSAS